MDKPRDGEGLFVRIETFDNEDGSAWTMRDISEVELSPGQIGRDSRSPSILHEWIFVHDTHDTDVLDLIEHAVRKVRPGAYHLGYAMARINELRRRLTAGIVQAISCAVRNATSEAEEKADLRMMEDSEIAAEVINMQSEISQEARLIDIFRRGSDHGAVSSCAEDIGRAWRRIGLLELEQDRRAALSNHERLAEMRQRSATKVAPQA